MRTMVEKIVPDYEEEYRGLKIEIIRDEDPESPRDWYNVGTMCCEHGRYDLGDGGMSLLIDDLKANPRCYLYQEEGDEAIADKIAELNSDDPEDWRGAVSIAEAWGYVVLPLYLYDHSGITMSCAPFSCPWDSGQVGVIFCSKEKYKQEGFNEEQCINRLKAEVATYNQYLLHDVWGYVIKDENDEEMDSCWGIYGEDYALQDAKEWIDAEAKRMQDSCIN